MSNNRGGENYLINDDGTVIKISQPVIFPGST